MLHLLCVKMYWNICEYVTVKKLYSPNMKENYVKGLI